MSKKLINITEVVRRTSDSRSSIYRRMGSGTFPRPVKLGPRRVAWVESEVDAHLAARIAERDGEAA